MRYESHPFSSGVVLVTPNTKHNLEIIVDVEKEEASPVTKIFSIFPHSNDCNKQESSESVTDHHNPRIKERGRYIGVVGRSVPLPVIPITDSRLPILHGVHIPLTVESPGLICPSLVHPSVGVVESGFEDTVFRPKPVHNNSDEKNDGLDDTNHLANHWAFMIGFVLHELFTIRVGHIPDLRESEDSSSE